jgi:cell division septation protein DedD
MTGLDTALRNRLTGAVILVLIAVLLLPELLTGSGGVASRSATGSNATRDAAGESAGAPLQTLQIDLSGSARAPAGSPSAALPETPEDAEPPPGPVQLPVPEVSQPPAEATPQAPVSEPVPEPVPEPVQQPVQQPARAPVVPEAVPATPAAAPAAAPAPRATRYYVQVGTFATRERAEAAQKDLARRGFEVIINETTSGARRFHRVRVGPVADRAAAVELDARLRPLAPDRAIVAVP